MFKKSLILGAFIMLIAAGCGKTTNNAYYPSSNYHSQTVEVENPYNSGTGHSAGYDWAQETGGSCNTGKSSFDEGCEEYYSQEDNGGY